MTLDALGTPGNAALLVVLLAGHVLGDFLLQTQRVADLKEERTGPLLLHGALVLAAQLGVLLPIWTWPAAGLMVAAALMHTACDAIRTRVPGGASLVAFFLD
jgi:hypothetical protein